MPKRIKVIVIILMTALDVLMNGLALSVMWQWFICHTFNIGELTLAQSSGIMLLLSLASFAPSQSNGVKVLLEKLVHHDKLDTAINDLFTSAISAPLIVMAVGYIISRFL